MTFEHDPSLASDLRQTVSRAWQEEAEEDEQLTALADRRRLNLADLAKEMVNKGERVAVEYGGHSFSGVVVGGGADHLTIQGAGLKADIRLDAGYWSVVHATERADTATGVATNESILARLAEHAEQRNTVRLAIPGGDLVIGRVTVVAEDHIELEDADNRHVYVPTALILAVIRSTDYQ
jgi:hypothetical protein